MTLQEWLSFLPPQYQGKNYNLRDATFSFPLFTLAADGTDTQPVQINNTVLFLCGNIYGRVYTSAAPETSVADPGVMVSISVPNGQDITVNDDAIWSSLVGDGASPSSNGNLAIPHPISGGGQVSITLSNLTGVAYLARITLKGIQVFQ